ncbi:MAG: hypothetical protein JSV06_00870, partial [Myxococcales bacterium]
MSAVRTGVLTALVMLCSYPSRGDAQATYYRTIPLGERAIGMGTAYTGIANDPSATYYNPGGLMTGGRFQLLGSLMSLVFLRGSIEDAFDSPEIDQTLTYSRSTSLPHFIGTVIKFGKKAYGDHRYAVGYSSFEIARENLGVGFTQIEPQASADLSLNSNYRMRWWGVSFAAQTTKKLSLGITAFLSEQSYNYSEDIALAGGGTLGDAGVRVGGSSVVSDTRVGTHSWHFVFRLGALYRINPKWQVGLMFQPPGAPIKESGNVFRRFVSNLDGEDTFFVFNEGDFETRMPIPFELRVGAEYKVDALTTLSFDAAITGPVKDQTVFARPPELEGAPGSLGAYFPNTTERRITPNGAIGAEHLFGKVVVAGGLSTNISASPKVPETATQYTPAQINLYGASFAVGVDAAGYRLTLGATGYFGVGDALAFTLDREAQVAFYRQTKATAGGLLLYIAGAVSVASRGAQDVEKKYKERKARKAEENGDEEDPAEDAGADTDADTDADTGTDTDADTGTGTDADTDA